MGQLTKGTARHEAQSIAYEAALIRYKLAQSEFEAAHPNYRRQCGGSGVVRTIENGAPHGAGFWAMPVEDVCPACAEEGYCPLCGEQLLWDEEADVTTCTVCGWADNKDGQPVAPEAPEPY